MTLYEKLSKIQQGMKVPKDLKNTFGNYNYRNAEKILEAFKPLESEYSVMLVLTDSIEQVGSRYYIKATAVLYDLESDAELSVSASARESETKKGMDDSQITGTASSYARKYALNGLFLLDDTKDADTNEYLKESNARHEKEIEGIIKYFKNNGIDPDRVAKGYKLKSLFDAGKQHKATFLNPDNLELFKRKFSDE